MTEPIKPALDAEQWTHREFGIAGDRQGDVLFGYVDVETGKILLGWNGEPLRPIANLAALAALALYGQSFGFTQEDVRLLRETISPLWDTGVTESHRQQRDREDAAYASLADRIAALLPPEKPAT